MGFGSEQKVDGKAQALPGDFKVGGAEDPQTRRVLGLDVLRALAIAGVLLAHTGGAFGLEAIPFVSPTFAGWAGNGVELFFALSGFLIGRLLLQILARGASVRAWWTFMIRRWMRTLPLYFVWGIAAILLTAPPGFFRTHLLKYATLTQNLAWPMPLDNFYGATWSLTVEEWFYLLFSMLLLGIGAYRRRLAMPLSLLAFLIVPFLLRSEVTTHYITHTVEWDLHVRKVAVLRLDAIAFGVAMAWFSWSWPRLFRAMALPGLALGTLLLMGPFFIPGFLPAASAGALIFSYLNLGFALWMPAASLLRSGGGVLASGVGWLSTRSYALYLNHLPLFEVGRRVLFSHGYDAPTSAVISLLASLVIAEIMHRWIERPIMNLRPRQFADEEASPRAA